MAHITLNYVDHSQVVNDPTLSGVRLFAENGMLEVTTEGDTVVIKGSGPLHILPSASNEVYITVISPVYGRVTLLK